MEPGKNPFVRSSQGGSSEALDEATCSYWSGPDRRHSEQHQSLPQSNIGFKLLKKAGWKEGTGLGVEEQGIRSPVEASLKFDKRGIGAERKIKKKIVKPEHEKKDKRQKKLSKAARRAAAEDARRAEQALASEFFRMFLPDNV